MNIDTTNFTKDDIILFLKLFKFELDVTKWEDKNTAIVPRPFMRFKYTGKGNDHLKEPFPIVIYNDDTFDVIIEKISEALQTMGEKNKASQITKLILSL